MIQTVIVDDEPAVIKWLTYQVHWEDCGYRICGSFLGGRDALEFLRRSRVQLLITDVRMPDMSGIELIERVRALLPDMHIIVISAHSEFSYAREAIKLGVEDYLLKPIDQNELTETLRKIREMIDGSFRSGDQDAFRNTMLRRWLGSSALDYTFKTQARIAGIELDENRYMALAIRSACFDAQPGLLQKRAEEAFSRHVPAKRYFLSLNTGDLACVICGCDENYRRRVFRIHAEMTGGAPRNESDVRISAGPPVRGYGDLNISYEAARRYLAVIGMTDSPVLFCEDYTADFENNPRRGLAIQRFRRMLHAGNLQKAEEASLEMIGEDAGPQERRRTAIGIAAQALEILENRGNGPVIADLPQLASQFRKPLEKEQTDQWIRSFYQSLERAVRACEKPLHPRVRDCLSYIHAEYTNPNLCLNGIAERLGISTAYLGQMFKTQTGKYFNDFLCDVRLDAAYRILIESEDSVGDVARQTGFTSQSYMNRLFKVRYKVSPNEFRSLFRRSDIRQEP